MCINEDVISMTLKNFRAYVFVKDANLRFLWCNEKFAEIAGLDSPSQIVYKSDYDMPWSKTEADFFQCCDQGVFKSGALLNSIETTHGKNGIIQVFGSKQLFKTRDKETLLLMGHYIDVTSMNKINESAGGFVFDGKKLFLGEPFAHETLTLKQIHVLKKLLLGATSDEIAKTLFISQRTVKKHIEAIKIKMKCAKKGDLIKVCYEVGLFSYIQCIGNKGVESKEQ